MRYRHYLGLPFTCVFAVTLFAGFAGAENPVKPKDTKPEPKDPSAVSVPAWDLGEGDIIGDESVDGDVELPQNDLPPPREDEGKPIEKTLPSDLGKPF